MMNHSLVDWMLQPFSLEVPDLSLVFSDLINDRTRRLLSERPH